MILSSLLVAFISRSTSLVLETFLVLDSRIAGKASTPTFLWLAFVVTLSLLLSPCKAFTCVRARMKKRNLNIFALMASLSPIKCRTLLLYNLCG